MTDLVVLSLERWDRVWRRNQHLVSGLLAADPKLRVLFVEPPADPMHDLVTRHAPRWGHRPRSVEGRSRLLTYQPVKWMPRRVDRRADRRLAQRVMSTARRVGFERPLLWINDPGAADVSALSGWPTLYDITDDWLAADRADSEHSRLAASEALLLSTAAEVVACSPELVRRKTPVRVGRPMTLIPNAVDVAAYLSPTQRPIDLPTKPVALYVGTLHSDRLDIPLTADTASALRPAGTLVLVGPDLLTAEDSHRLRDAGALILGTRSRDEVIAYLQHADVLVVPHLVNAFTDSLDPIKLYEYQAVDKPVISTPVAGFRDAASDRITLADAERFAAAIGVAVAEGQPDRGGSSSAPDWSIRVDQAQSLLSRLAGQQG